MLYRLAYALFWSILRPALALLGGFRVIGVENIPSEGPVLLAPNHASYSDPPIIGLATPRAVWFMTKAHLFEHRALAAVMRVFHAFPVNVEGVDREALRFSEDLLKRGEVLCVFPEGQVSDDGRLQPLKPGLALLALRAGAPIVPVGMWRTHEFLPPNRALPGFARGGVVVRFGEPLSLADMPEGLRRQERVEWVTGRVDQALRELLPLEQQPQ